MTHTIYELHEYQKPTRKIQFRGDTLNLDNICLRTEKKPLFGKPSVTLKMKTGESLTYENVTEKEMAELFKR